MAALTTWCRLMRTGPVCAIPCDDCRATSGKLARAGITIDPDRFYDAPPTSEETMTYQPDSAEVRKIASRIITSEIDTIRDLGAADVGEMAEDELSAIYNEIGEGTREADDAADALIAAVRKDISAAVVSVAWPETGA